jgi:hypothetical protein
LPIGVWMTGWDACEAGRGLLREDADDPAAHAANPITATQKDMARLPRGGVG